MQYEKFKNIFNETIFEESKAVLIEKIAKYPNRYIGLFRPTKPKAKILQNLLQSHEIRFGDAFETIIEEYLREFGYEILEKRFVNSDDDELNLDQCFKADDKVYFIEQKVRDDHDSTKKRGQIANFEKKLSEMVDKYNESNLVGIFYFIDPDLQKNKNYYQAE
ncbi:restriction endonuclease, partial [Candidatus Falkowbacteria bacterium]|nr:restriction endonuclease [Candidatus Falkowbacteria bacterium]